MQLSLALKSIAQKSPNLSSFEYDLAINLSLIDRTLNLTLNALENTLIKILTSTRNWCPHFSHRFSENTQWC